MSNGPKLFNVLLWATALLAVTTHANAAGFDSSYNVFNGDLNGDGRIDLYVKSSSTTVVPLDDITIVLGPPVRDFVLQNRGDGSFDLIANLTRAQRDAASAWPSADVGVSVRDVDVDGHPDLDLLSIAAVIPRAQDQIVLSSTTRGAPPRQLITKTPAFENFHQDLVATFQDPDYFDKNAPNRVVSREPGSRRWYGSVRNAGDFASTNFLLSWCGADFPGSQCNLSPVPPNQCVQVVNLFGDAGQFVGNGTRNVCGDYIHIFVYVPGSVTVAKDYSVFDSRARESKEILDRLQTGCSLFTPSPDSQRLTDIFNGVYNSALVIADGFVQNSVAHPPAPGDELFNRADPTFHHYDVRNKVCDRGQPACETFFANSFDNRGLRAFTYPSALLVPMLTRVDGVEKLTAFISLVINKPLGYVIPYGTIVQRRVQGGYWSEGIQNITLPDHRVFPGTITRKIFSEGNSLYVRTHGIGVNRFNCVADFDPRIRGGVIGARMFFASTNDYFGAKAFNTLDVVMIKAFRQTNGGYPNRQGKPTGPAGMDDRPATQEDIDASQLSRAQSQTTE